MDNQDPPNVFASNDVIAFGSDEDDADLKMERYQSYFQSITAFPFMWSETYRGARYLKMDKGLVYAMGFEFFLQPLELAFMDGDGTLQGFFETYLVELFYVPDSPREDWSHGH